MPATSHGFTTEIIAILNGMYPGKGKALLEASPLLQYLNIKTKAANRGSKSRAGFANHYALYVLVEDYLKNKFDLKGKYENYEGAQFSHLLQRQRKLPFGSKLQNHALNHRLNEEFRKYFPDETALPIIRDVETNRYWINENLLHVKIGTRKFNTGKAIIRIIQAYIKTRMESFNSFIDECKELLKLKSQDTKSSVEFIRKLLRPNIDARIFEIVSYSILKQHYAEKIMYWGWSSDELNEEYLILYKTGRTNANDGGIDFVMRPSGRFFQVTETVDAGKYFLDIDKVQRYPITFVVKTEETPSKVRKRIRQNAKQKYSIERIVRRYMSCVEEVINVPMLTAYFNELVTQGKIKPVIEEIMLQSRVEFNVEEDD